MDEKEEISEVAEPVSNPIFSEWLFGKRPKRTLSRLVLMVSVFFVTFRFFLVPVRVTGDSMAMSYLNGEINFVLKNSYRETVPKRGDVVAVWLDRRGLCFLKRVIALPGEEIEIFRGQVLIDGTPIPEPYVWERKPWFQRPVKMGPDQYYLIGDNRSMEIFEHEHGIVVAEEIMGRILIGGLKEFDYSEYSIPDIPGRRRRMSVGE
ncbi:signal peptidase I [Verrucomicrobia bacterium]|nr:signal peptidase I [Verrucomicrobiota bacterium]